MQGSFDKIIDYAILFAIICVFNTIWIKSMPLYAYSSILIVLICAIVTLIACFRIARNKLRFKVPMLGWLVVVGLAFSMCAVTSSNISVVFYAFLPIVAAILFSCAFLNEKDVRSVLSRFVNIVVVFAIVSLLFYLLGTMLHLLPSSGFVSYQWDQLRNTKSYYGLYFEGSFIDFLGMHLSRNAGVFTEAPMFNFLLCSALALNTLLLRGSNWKSIVMTVAVITTFSTTGYIVIIVIATYCVIAAHPKQRIIAALRFAAIPVAIVSFVLLFQLLLGEKAGSSSYGIRSDHLYGCAKLFFSTFPFGVGLGHRELFYEVFVYEQGLSVGTAYFLAQTGIAGIAIYIAPLVYCAVLSYRSRDNEMIAFQVVYIILLFLTNAFSAPLTWMLFALTTMCYPVLHSESLGVEQMENGINLRKNVVDCKVTTV